MIKKFMKDEAKLVLLALPGFSGLMVFYVVPFMISFYYTLLDNSVSRNFVGLQNFADLLSNGAFQLALGNTAVFMAICVPLNFAFPLALALLLNRTKYLKNIFCLMILLPLVIPTGSTIHFWKSVFSLNGILNGMFFPDAPVNWLDTEATRAFITLIFIWKNAGYNMILFLAGLKNIPGEYYEYASVEGAGAVRKFFSITLVYLTPTIFLVFIMSIINSFKAFREIYLISGAYPHQSIYMLQHYMNNQFSSLNYQRLTSAAYILSAFIIALVLSMFFLQNKRASQLS